MPRVYIVEDDIDLASILRESLTLAGNTPVIAGNGLLALQRMRRLPPDLVILDINMPVLDGFGLARRMRRDPLLAHTPILFLTVHADYPSKLDGYSLGADDYITKPFDLPELHARMQATLRRCKVTDDPERDILRAGCFALHLDACRVDWQGRSSQLTETESSLLRHLMCHPATPVSAQQLLEEALDYPAGTGDLSTVRFHIRNLRRKLEDDPAHPVHLCTAVPRGYCFNG